MNTGIQIQKVCNPDPKRQECWLQDNPDFRGKHWRKSIMLIFPIYNLVSGLGRTRYWVEIGEKTFPNNDTVFRYMKPLLDLDSGNYTAGSLNTASPVCETCITSLYLKIWIFICYSRLEQNNYLCTCDLYTPVHNVLEAWIYITWGS